MTSSPHLPLLPLPSFIDNLRRLGPMSSLWSWHCPTGKLTIVHQTESMVLPLACSNISNVASAYLGLFFSSLSPNLCSDRLSVVNPSFSLSPNFCLYKSSLSLKVGIKCYLLIRSYYFILNSVYWFLFALARILSLQKSCIEIFMVDLR